VFQSAQLVVTHPTVVMELVQLWLIEPQYEIGGATVAGQTFDPAWKTPGLPPAAAGQALVLNDEFLLIAFRINERRIRLAIVPSVGISGPLPILMDEESGLDSPAGCRIFRFAFER